MRSCLEVQMQWGQPPALELREEITLLERRIRLMGEEGRCAYERAMSRPYQIMVAERWRQLVSLEGKRA